MFDIDPQGEIESFPCPRDGCDGNIVKTRQEDGAVEWECDTCGWTPNA